MRVKRLEVQGFKSFKDKTQIHFADGITGIVGPNGCGKSNIVDAFFWVMGEQSYKHMRGSGSDDLIFNGSTRHAASGVAEATLVLEHEQVDTANAAAGASIEANPQRSRSKEIAVTRKVFRDGQGEYYLNGVACRLKDIQELFMDTGVGAKGYSVIEQGQIGKVINAKPEERRLLIEEAAGIAKYKARKRESLRKMEVTEGNLSRLRDLLQEIERNLASLDRQAQKARLHKKYRDDLAGVELRHGRRKKSALEIQLDIERRRKDLIESELAGMREELKAIEESIAADQVALYDVSRSSDEKQESIRARSLTLAEEESQIAADRVRGQELEAAIGTLRVEREETSARLEEDRKTGLAIESSAQEADAEQLAAAQESRKLDEDTRQLRQELAARRRENDARKKSHAGDSAAEAESGARIASAKARIESLHANLEGARAAEAAASAAAGEAAAAREREERESARLAKEREEAEARAAESRRFSEERAAHLESGTRAREELLSKLSALRARRQSLADFIAAHEGFGDASREALDWARSAGHADQLQALADQIQVDRGFEPCVEGWLESRFETLIAARPEVAWSAIARATENGKGRIAIQIGAPGATRVIGGRTPSESLEEELTTLGLEWLGSLRSKVAFAPELPAQARACATALLDGIHVLKRIDPESAPALLASGWSYVDLAGNVLEANGTWRGGGTVSAKGAGLLGLRVEAEKVREELGGAESEEAALRERLASETEETRLAGLAAARASAAFETVDRDLAIVMIALEHSRAREREARERWTRATGEIERLSGAIEGAAEETGRLEASLTAIARRRTELEEEIHRHEEQLGSIEASCRKAEEELSGARIREASAKEKASGARRELQGQRTIAGERKSRCERLAANQREKEAELARIRERAPRFEISATQAREALAEDERVLGELKSRQAEATQAISRGQEKVRELHSAGDAKTKLASELAIRCERAQGEVLHLLSNLEEKHGKGCLDEPERQFDLPDPIVPAEMTAEEEAGLVEEIERLRERIRKLGEVNTTAVEEFEELSKRHESLLAEKADLERSLENLSQAIDHINKTSEVRFKSAFEAIASRFERLFPIIFGGGAARLAMVWPETAAGGLGMGQGNPAEGRTDVLECGIEILAQPPGKKVTNISLLSGGEKALTALSLVFAIFMVKPSPFCILDEVDAPLDDANIGKFNALLREMSANSQFILITHNKKTMEMNQTLYGVTMEEPGVSKMVSIQLA